MWRIGWGSCVKLAATILFLFLVIHYWDLFFAVLYLLFSAAVPLVIGFCVAYVVNILMNVYETRYRKLISGKKLIKYKRPVCMTLAFASVALCVTVLWRMIVPVLVDCIYTLSRDLPGILEELTQWLQENFALGCTLLKRMGLMSEGNIDWELMVKTAIETMFHNASSTMENLMNVVITLITTAVTFVLALVFAVYLLMRKEKLKRDFKNVLSRWFGEGSMRRIFHVLGVVNDAFHSFIVGQCVEAVILGILCIAGMWLLGFPYPVMIGCLVGFTALIPLGGAYIGAVVGGLMIFSVSPWKALLFLVFLVVLQQVEGNVIYPRVVGTSMGLPGIWVLAAVIVGGSLAGILGMLLAVPLTAAAYRLFKEWLGD